MPFSSKTNSQRGIAQVLLLLFLLAGIAVGTVIIQNRTNFLPRAQDCNPGIDNNCNTGGGSEFGDPGAEQAAAQRQEQADLEKGAREAGKSVDDYRVNDCKANPGKPGCSEILKRADTTSDGQSFDTQSDETKNRFSAIFCGGNPNANCAAAKAQWAKEHTTEVANGGKSTTEEQRQKQQEEAANRNKATLDASRKSLDPDGVYKNEGAGAYVAKCVESGKSPEECDNRKKVLEEIIKAQEAHDYAVTTKFDNPVTQDAAYTQAKLLARAANCDAVAADIRGSNCVLDLGDTQNIITASDGKRVFIGCSIKDTDPKRTNEQGSCRKVLNYRGEDGKIHELSSDEAKALLCPKDPANCSIDPGAIYDMAQIPTELRKSAQDLCLAAKIGCLLGQAASSNSIPPTKENGHINIGDQGTKIPNWKPSDCSCGNSCSTDQAIACYKAAGGSSIDQLAAALSDMSGDPVKNAIKAAQALGATTAQVAYTAYNTALSRGKTPAQAWDEVKNIIDVRGVTIPPAVSQAASTTNPSVIASIDRALEPTTTNKCSTERNVQYCTSSTTTNFQDKNNRTLVTVTVTQGTKNNIGEGQTVISYNGNDYTIEKRITSVTTKEQLQTVINEYNNKNKSKPIPIN